MSDLRKLTDGHTSSVFEYEGVAFEWPRCAIHGCSHYACKRENSIYCDPHWRAHEAGATVMEMQAAQQARSDKAHDGAET